MFPTVFSLPWNVKDYFPKNHVGRFLPDKRLSLLERIRSMERSIANCIAKCIASA